jgi:hypothetical protein
MFVRICPYLPFSARVCLNQYHWLANRMRQEGIDFKQCANAFIRCAAPDRLQDLADTLTPFDLLTCGQKWLARLTPFFTATEREQAGCQHRLFFSQVEFCDNHIFHRRAALDKLGERLLDANRTIGRPNKITVIFGRRISKHYRGKLRTDARSRAVRSHRGRQYLHHRGNPLPCRRGTCCSPEDYTLASLRYDSSSSGLRSSLPSSPTLGDINSCPRISICLVFLKLFERVYAPLTACLLSPVTADARLASQKRSQLDRLYQRVIDDLDTLVRTVDLKAA